MSNLGNIIGTGFLTLDVILNGSKKTPPKFQAGGSFGNVLTILSFLGFNTYPISRLADNKVTDLLLADIQKWDVNIDLIFKQEKGSTPIIIHRILKDKYGKPHHKFEFKNPNNGKWLPSYRPFLSKDVKKIEQCIPKFKLYYFDRVSRSSIELAKYARNNDALVYFEPSSYNNSKQFQESLNNSDIIKFSSDRIKNYKEIFPKNNSILEIETLGIDGVNYRFKSDNWIHLKPFQVNNVIDTAGAGDWSSSGIIKMIATNGELVNQTNEQIEQAINYGQALGAINCLFEGARGAMYNANLEDVDKLTSLLINNQFHKASINFKDNTSEFDYSVVESLFNSI
ncbi:PfkB family carbohydrate kinase [uncultured Draconibacterium sp.]|uniref:PfkB family carbohydrate kinase n=1 Tax=uncultured Draconibacterium sp. TaxID=1573823 RepID=UPI003216A8A3